MNPYKEILRKFFSEYVSALRKRRGLTQEQMAEKLRITGRAYSDLERGIYCFSAVALVFLLLIAQDRHIMGRYRNGRAWNVLTWATIVIITVLTVVMFALQALGY